jgi:hypothetical protein
VGSEVIGRHTHKRSRDCTVGIWSLIKHAGKPETRSGVHIVSICVPLCCGTQNSRRYHRVIHYENMRP